MNALAVDDAAVRAEVARQFWDYERAFMANDVETLVAFFWDDDRLTRYGIADRQLGIDQMRAFRRATPVPAFTREIEHLRIACFGRDMAVACCEFVRSDTALRGFQSQTWVRLASGDGAAAAAAWRIVAAHVSMIPWP